METVTGSVECHPQKNTEQKTVKSKRREFAPLASFEDLEEFKPSKPSSAVRNCLPIVEDCATDSRVQDSKNAPATASGIAASSCTASAHQAPLKSKHPRPETIRPIPVPVLPDDSGSDNVTPPTPRIDISCASSSSTISDELPSSEKELRRYGLGLDCSEEVEDLRSSTEEIAFEESTTTPEGPLEAKHIAIEALRRGSHPANIFSRKISTVTINDSFVRKPSVYSLHTDVISPRAGRHASFGAASPRPKSCAPSPTPTCRSGRRSVSPHLMMYETSFCGNRPTTVDLEPEIFAPPEIVTSQAQIHSSPVVDSESENQRRLSTTQAEVAVAQHSSPPRSPVAGPSTSSATFKIVAPPWSERFVIPNQPSLDFDDDSLDKVPWTPTPASAACASVTSTPPHAQADSGACAGPTPRLNCCAKEESTDYSEKVDENISEGEEGDQDDRREDQIQTKFPIPPNDITTPQETKGLFLEETLDDDSNLPYVPTTLPQEKSVAVPIVPVKDRVGHFVPTTPIRRPRSTQPPNLTSIEDYISVNSHSKGDSKGASGQARPSEKMKISLPKEESLEGEPKTPKRDNPKPWTDFAEMGLRNPRNLRRQQVEDEFK